MSTSSAPSLLLLPPPPQSLDRASLKAAYLPAFTAALADLASARVSPIAVLDIAVPWPALRGQAEKPRSHLFRESQHLLAELYSLISLVCAQKGIELDGPGGIDPRVLLVEYDSSQLPSGRGGAGTSSSASTANKASRSSTTTPPSQTPTPPYAGTFDVPAGTPDVAQPTTTSQSSPPPPSHPSSKTHSVVAVGGTFDHLHAGHKLLLTATALMLQPPSPLGTSQPQHRRLIIGITGDELLKNKKYAEQLESWKRREEGVINFLLPILSFTTLPTSEDITRTHFDTPGGRRPWRIYASQIREPHNRMCRDPRPLRSNHHRCRGLSTRRVRGVARWREGGE
ncbi:hypothetical protein VE04_07593 [Pseudogymnoascus sp. 24MN13]|nr:hypothetical protein VE04_07593 [Pseudogymnoascus sp. 24MN13]